MTPVLDYAALEAAPVASAPFRHVVIERFVAPDSLPLVTRDLPPMSSGGSFPPESLRLGPSAQALVEALQGPRLKSIVAEKFGLDLADAPTMLTLRGRTREQDGKIHTDSVAKLVTILLYLNPLTEAWSRQEGCLRLLRGPDDIEDYAVEVPPVNGTLLIFPNGPDTWHGHRAFVGQRYTIQLNYMADSAKARHEMRRHHLSAFVKRFVSAA